MKKSFLLFFAVFNCLLIYASFPVLENINITQFTLLSDSEISTVEKIIWFLLGVTFYGIGLAILYQLFTKKRGPIKFSLFGFLAIIFFIAILLIGFFNDFDNPFIFG